MRMYLDTNILIYLLTGRDYEIDNDAMELLTDSSNLLFTSPVCVHEFIYLRQSGKISVSKDWKKDTDVVQRLTDFGIEITNVTPAHLQAEERLPLIEKHKDPNDRLIIAQAISDKAMLVSSDSAFPMYCKFGLLLHKNRRG